INKFLPNEKGNSSQKIYNDLITDSQPYDIEEVIFLVNQLNEIGGVHNFIKTMAKNIKDKRKCKIILIAAANKNFNNRKNIEFESSEIDIILTPQINRNAILKILKNTNGTIITTQMWAHKYFQKYLRNKNVIAMFHGDVEYAQKHVEIFDWEMNAIKNR